MATFEQHCAEALQTFGKPHAEVHLLWGNEAAEAARQHIITDLKLEGWRESDPFPKDEDHYKRMGLF